MMKRSHTNPIFRSISFQIAGIALLALLAVGMLLFNGYHSAQASGTVSPQVRFLGSYRVGDGSWQEIAAGRHIPADRGDVILRGNFHMYAPDGTYLGVYTGETPIALYLNHINVKIREGDRELREMDIENPLYGESACGVSWLAFSLKEGREVPVEIRIHNPHRFGNEMSVDQMLSHLSFWGDIDFERSIMAKGQSQRGVGLFFVIVAFVLLGVALFSALLHIPSNRLIWLIGLTILAAGFYMLYSAVGVSVWSESVSFNTSMLGFSMMFYMLFNSAIITSLLDKTKKVGYLATTVTGVLDGIYFLLPMAAGVRFYDTWLFWVLSQTAANGVLLVCLAVEYRSEVSKKHRWTGTGMALMLLAFEADLVGTAVGAWRGGVVSAVIFSFLFVVALIVVLRIIPERFNAAARANELELQRSRLEAEKNIVEAQLKESRISIMLSQIQPHFIYNTLGTIERMCLKDPEKAFHLVRNFSLYLRGNFSELNSVTPIRFAEELRHIEHYVNIEKVRFPDMEISYEVEIMDFVLPALSVQPLVENAIKHGLMPLESGGSVVIRSFETPTHFCVEVKDDGVGFDVNRTVDEKKHVGLKNIRGRLQAMVNGELVLESRPGGGTRALILIPKEVIA